MQYLVKKGHHYSNHGIKYHFGITRKKFGFLFSPSCLYSILSPKKNTSINKLFGWSYGHHHRNSVRVGWRPDTNGKIDLFFYLYNNGKNFTKYFETIEVSEEYEINITVSMYFVLFELYKANNPLENIKKDTHGFIRPWFRWGYYLWFYFGGKLPAPQDMTAYIFK
ncbi:MAG: hypothetical protein AABY22_06450 [Nanoarchaeota archaeon]